MNQSDDAAGAAKPGRLWWKVLLLVLILLGADSARRLQYIVSVTHNTMAWPLLLPERDETSPTGYALGQRRLFLPAGGFDGYHYVMQTQQRIENGAWRTRHVDYDNYPNTREMHWSSLLSWILEATARCDSALTGLPLGIALERTAPYAHTLVFALALVTIIPLTARRFGSAAASILALGQIFVPQVYEFSLVGNFDHHGIICICAMLTMLCLIAGGAGWVRDDSTAPRDPALARWLPTEAGARRWFAASAIAGGAAMWVSCATQIPVFVGLALGMLFGLIGSAHPGGPWRYEPKLWRWWARIGAATSLVFYLVEYFPAEMSLHLEVNHPLHALAWLGGGEVMYRLARFAQLGRAALTPRTLFSLGLALGVMALAPLVMVIRPESFVVQDRFAQILTRYYVEEGWPLHQILVSDTLLNNWVFVTCLPLLAPLQVWLLLRGKLNRPHQGMLCLAFFPCLVMSLLTFLQVRWIGVAQALWLVNFAVTVWLLQQTNMLVTPVQKMALTVFLAAVFLPGMRFMASGLADFARECATGTAEFEPPAFDLTNLGMRDMAFRLRQREGAEATCVLGGPTDTTALVFHGNLKGLGTLYWENIPGLKAASEIFGAPTAEQALERILQRKVKYIVLFSYFPPVEQSVRLHRLLTPDEELPSVAFGLSLVKDVDPPRWLRPVFIPTPQNEAFGDRKATVYQIVPEQSEREAAFRRAQYRLRQGQSEEAAKQLDEILAQYPDYLPALVEQVLVAPREKTRTFQALVERVRKNLEQADGLELGDRVKLAIALDRAEQSDEARRQFMAALKAADEKALRHLDEAALVDLVQYVRRWNLEQVRPDLIGPGTLLLPKHVRP